MHGSRQPEAGAALLLLPGPRCRKLPPPPQLLRQEPPPPVESSDEGQDKELEPSSVRGRDVERILGPSFVGRVDDDNDSEGGGGGINLTSASSSLQGLLRNIDRRRPRRLPSLVRLAGILVSGGPAAQDDSLRAKGGRRGRGCRSRR